MIKLIVNYSYQKWTGYEYTYPKGSKILTFDKLEDVSDESIIRKFGTRTISIINITQIL